MVLRVNTILSNCHIDSEFEIPGEFVFHTVPFKGGKYVTVAFGTRDDLKATVSDAASLKLGGDREVGSVLRFSNESGKEIDAFGK